MSSPQSKPEPINHEIPTPPPPPEEHHISSDHCRAPLQCRPIIAVSLLLFTLSTTYVFWPSDPSLHIVRLKIDHVKVHTAPRITVDISLALSVKVQNVDLYSMTYSFVNVTVAYRGKELGHVMSEGGHVKARRSSYFDALVYFYGVDVFKDVVYLLQDLAKGTVPFDTVTEVKGQLGLFFFRIPLRAKVSCEVHVNTKNQTIVRQNCY